jgi:transcriptional regulator with XRE-family HTH domain
MRRRRSQMDLALDAGVSPRHLSFIETGRTRPSPETLLAIAHCLDVPLRERNDLLLAAGFAPRYAERALDETEMASARAALERILAAHDPLPGVVVDRLWNVVLANQGGSVIAQLLPPALTTPTINVFRASLHPEGLAPRTLNFNEWALIALGALRLQALLDEVQAYPNVQAALASHSAPPVGAPMPLTVPYVLDLPQLGEVRFFTTITTFGTPRDITLEELSVELFYPADDASAGKLRAGR